MKLPSPNTLALFTVFVSLQVEEFDPGVDQEHIKTMMIKIMAMSIIMFSMSHIICDESWCNIIYNPTCSNVIAYFSVYVYMSTYSYYMLLGIAVNKYI